VYLKNEAYQTPQKVGCVTLQDPLFSNFSKFLESLENRPKDLFTMQVMPQISEELFISVTFTIMVNVWRFGFPFVALDLLSKRFERKVKEGESFDDDEREFFYNTMIKDFESFFTKFSGYTYVDTNLPDVKPLGLFVISKLAGETSTQEAFEPRR
jgi:hypothetical protein